MEISTLCGVDACAIIYRSNELQPEVWPSHSGVQSVLYKFLTFPPLEQSRKMFDQQSFLKQRIVKAQDQLQKKKIRNQNEMMSLFMFNCLNTGFVNDNINLQIAKDLLSVIDRNLNDLDRKITRDQHQ
ncbi:PREDICTED: agamous-like MADS-box protein AGL80 [Lupinus angustifolius]|nr:PREDICTED: agamous-like MADS-box protein AGL80 [Lupinus angustifolius]